VNFLRAELKLVDPVRLVQIYVWVVGALLVLDGALQLLATGLGVLASIGAADWGRGLLHLATGVALLVVSWISRDGYPIRVAWAGVIFGAFYVALGVLGLTVDQPFGLQLGMGENVFHIVVGAVALILGGWALRTLSLAAVQSRSGAHPAELRNGQVTRRPARRRRGKTRGRGRGRAPR
jgi:hypothetical protein